MSEAKQNSDNLKQALFDPSRQLLFAGVDRKLSKLDTYLYTRLSWLLPVTSDIVFSVPLKKNVDIDFFKVWSDDMAYVLGFLFADGTFDVNVRGAYYFGFHICDKELLISIRQTLASDHKISERRVRVGESPRYRLQIGSKEMCHDLMRLGVVPSKTKRLRFPKMPRRYMPHFVRGYFDGDGHVWSGLVNKKRPNPTQVLMVGFTSSSQPFLNDLYACLRTFGLQKGGVYCKKNAFCIKYSTADAERLYGVMYGQPFKSSLSLERKKRRFEEFARNKMRE